MKVNEILFEAASTEDMLQANRENSVAYLDPEQRSLVLKTLLGDKFDPDDRYATVHGYVKHEDPFINSVYVQWISYGKLSQKQVDAVLRYAKKIIRAQSLSSMLPDYKVGEKTTFKGKVTSIQEVQVPGYGYGAADIKTNKVTITTRANLKIAFKTNQEKLLKLVNSYLGTDQVVSITSKIVWIAPGKDYYSVSSRGCKIEPV
jgi:hypothetical protein